MDSQPSFVERAVLLKETAHQLQAAAETVLAESQRMEAAQQRFSERFQKRPGRSARR